MKNALATLAAVALSASVLSTPAEATVFGVTSPTGLSESVLFSFSEANPAGTFSAIGAVTINGGGVDQVDGLAISSSGSLFGFDVNTPGGFLSAAGASSRLISIDSNTAQANVVGLTLPDRIVGAAFDANDNLWALAADSELHRINIANGSILQTVALSRGGGSFVPHGDGLTADIAFHADNTLHVSFNLSGSLTARYETIDLGSGVVSGGFADSTNEPERGVPPGVIGAAFSGNSDDLFVLEANGAETLMSYDIGAANPAASRVTLISAIANGHNAGPGDLAASIPLADVPAPATAALMLLAAIGMRRRAR